MLAYEHIINQIELLIENDLDVSIDFEAVEVLRESIEKLYLLQGR
jgi:hypothetical protein